jgi:hypothetical protein
MLKHSQFIHEATLHDQRPNMLPKRNAEYAADAFQKL